MASTNGKDLPPDAGDALPGVEEVVIDEIDDQDETVPPEFRGCKVVELRTENGSVLLYKGKSGFTASEEQAKILIQAYRLEKESEAEAALSDPQTRPGGQPGKVSAVETPIPGDLVLRVLGYGADVPEKLQGSRLIQRGKERFYLTLDGEAIPEDVGRDLLGVWEVVDPDAASREDSSKREIDGVLGDDDAGLLEGEPTVTDGGQDLMARVLELAAKESGKNVAESAGPSISEEQPASSVSRSDAFGQQSHEVFGEKAGGAQSEDGPTMEAGIESSAKGEGLASMSSGDASSASETNDDSSTDSRETSAEASMAPGSEGNLSSGPTASSAGQEQPSVHSSSEPFSDEPSKDRQEAARPQEVATVSYSAEELAKAGKDLAVAADLLRRDLATSVLKIDELSPPVDEIRRAFWEAVAGTHDKHIERFVRRSLEMSEEILSSWRGSEDRRKRSWIQDMESGTLVLCAVNPVQAPQTDFLSLVTLVRLRSKPEAAESRVNRALDRLRPDLAGRFGKELMSKAVMETLADFVTGLMAEGRDKSRAVEDWLRARLTGTLNGALQQMREAEGISVPGFVERLLDVYGSMIEELGRHLTTVSG